MLAAEVTLWPAHRERRARAAYRYNPHVLNHRGFTLACMAVGVLLATPPTAGAAASTAPVARAASFSATICDTLTSSELLSKKVKAVLSFGAEERWYGPLLASWCFKPRTLAASLRSTPRSGW